MANLLLVSGAGRYADPWHPFAETSAVVAEILSGDAHDVTVREDVEAALTDLMDVDLLIMNVGNPHRGGCAYQTPRDVAEALNAYRQGGGCTLSLHVSAAAFSDVPGWRDYIGGHWDPGVSMHPDISPADIKVSDTGHVITAGLNDFTTFDERYAWLRVNDDVSPLLSHHHAGVDHPLLWARVDARGGRIVYDALGHDRRAFEAPEPRVLIRRASEWLLDSPIK